ncbi:MAG: ABC transporter permease [Planctomycetota bacterium]
MTRSHETALSGARRGPLGVLRGALRIARKELAEGFRDRQTLLYTFVLPVCMYPAMFWVMVQGVLVVQGQKAARDVVVAVAGPRAEAAAEALEEDKLRVFRLEAEGANAAASGSPEDVRTLLEAEDDDAPDAIVVLPEDLGAEGEARILFDSTDSDSSTAADRMEVALADWADELRQERAREVGVDPLALDPFEIESTSVAEDSDEGALLLSLMLPMLLVVMSVLGSFFPAVDLTAGEKERRTAETTMLLPVPSTSIHLGKILAVCASSMIATALNLIAIALSAQHLLDQLSGAAGSSISIELPFGALLMILPLAVLFSFFVSAALTGVASLAASFKEGQALLGPVQMLFIFPAMAASLPGLGLTVATACIPVVNVALAFRGLLVGDAGALPLAVCALSLVAYAGIAIAFAVKLRSSEAVALSGETISMKRLGSLLRS